MVPNLSQLSDMAFANRCYAHGFITKRVS